MMNNKVAKKHILSVMLNRISIFLIVSILSLSCKQATNEQLDVQLTNEFYGAIANDKAKKFEYDYDGLVPQESYFTNGKIKFLKFRNGPEAGFSEGKVYFNLATDSIEKYVLRIVEPEWKTYNDNMFDKYFDTIHIIYPSKRKMYRYVDNKLVDSTYDPYMSNWNVQFIYKMKTNTEKVYNADDK